jgi:ABC-type lipoprotein release transport system permease subunit
VEAVKMQAAALLRRGWRATILLGLLAGLAAGVAMGAWAAGRRTASAFDRFRAFADAPDLTVTFCPPELTEITNEVLVECLLYDAIDELATVQGLAGVDGAGRGSFRGVSMARPGEQTDSIVASGFVSVDTSRPFADGRPLVVEGRWYSAEAADEIVVNELVRDRLDLALGDELVLHFWSRDEIGSSTPEGGRFHGPEARVRVVGITRSTRDLGATTDNVDSVFDDSQILAGPGVAAVTEGAPGWGGIMVWADRADVVNEALARAFPGRLYNVSPAQPSDEVDPIAEAIRYEARGTLVFAGLAALAAAVFVGQALARQSRREWSDLTTLRALGLSQRQIAMAAGLRGLVTGALAALAALATEAALSPVGPVGFARKAEVDLGFDVDLTVMATGAVLALALATLTTMLPAYRLALRSSAGRRVRAGLGLTTWRTTSPSASVGLGMAVNGGRGGQGLPMGTALAGVTLAAAAVAAAAALSGSLTRLAETPEHYGATWDVSVASSGLDGFSVEALEFLRDSPEVTAAAGILGTDIHIEDEVMWSHALQPVEGIDDVVPPPITAGRAPASRDEIALGTTVMRRLGIEIGDTVEVHTTVSESPPHSMTVVGATIINDTYETSPGHGAVLTPEWLVEFAPDASVNPIVLRLAAGVDRAAFIDALTDATGGVVNGPVRQGAIVNVERVRYLPPLIAGLLAVLGLVSLAHALVLSVRRHRQHLAVLKALGFARHQVAGAVAWQATLLAVCAAAVGAPLGVAAGRWGWRMVADQLGVATPAVLPWLAVVVAVVGAVLVANLAAALPAFRAARLRPAEALRVE